MAEGKVIATVSVDTSEILNAINEANQAMKELAIALENFKNTDADIKRGDK